MAVYKVFVGRHGIRALGRPEAVLRGMTSKSMAARHVTFHGCCYYCGYALHSQMYCPLRWCKVCKMYGHSEAVCARARVPTAGAGSRRDEAEEEAEAEWD